MAGGNPNETRGRQGHDTYPTPSEVTEALLREFEIGGRVWEPCCGEGAMVDVLARHGLRVVAGDIRPNPVGMMIDFFSYEKPPSEVEWLITNPPFNLAEKIIRHAFRIGVPKMALVLKSSYWHAKGRVALFDDFQPSVIAPLTWRPDFLDLGRPTMEVMWCIWHRPNSALTIYEPLNKE